MRVAHPARPASRQAFTLVELLTAIAIIVILVAVLIPAVNSVRKSARVTATRAAFSALETALESFRADGQVGGQYPPSASDLLAGGRPTYRVANPYRSLPNGPGDAQIKISGAGLLVWALAGADRLGCPGFQTFRDTSQFWAQDTDAEFNTRRARESGAYALFPTGDDSRANQPVHPRVGPLVDLSKVRLTNWNRQADTQDGLGSFEIPAELDTAQSLNQRPPRRLYPVFLDSFDQPILYWRADPAGTMIADETPGSSGSGPRPQPLGGGRGIYHFGDNAGLLADGSGPAYDEDVLLLRPVSGVPLHRLRWRGRGRQGFRLYIRNKGVTAREEPFNADKYLLISAGPDGIFGSGDDIANFPHNGAELTGR